MKATLTAAAMATAILGAPQLPAAEAAARLASTQGVVMISTPTGYKRAYDGMDLFAGDRLLVLEGSSGVLSYPDGCTANVHENRIITIENFSICRGSNAEEHAFTDYDRGPIGGVTSNAHLLAGLVAVGIAVPVLLQNNSSPVSGE